MVTVAGATFSGSATLIQGAVRTFLPSVKLSVLRKISAHIEGVTRAAGYEFDLHPQPDEHGDIAPRVYRGRTVFGSDTPVPCVSINEGPVPDREPRLVGMNEIVREDDWVLYVQGWVETPKDNPTDPAYQLMAAVEKRLSEIISVRPSGMPLNRDAYMLGGAISGFAIGPGVVRPPQDQVSSKAFFYLPVIVRLPVDVSKPFVTA